MIVLLEMSLTDQATMISLSQFLRSRSDIASQGAFHLSCSAASRPRHRKCDDISGAVQLAYEKGETSTMVAQMDIGRHQGRDGEDSVDHTLRPGDHHVKTRADCNKLLCDSSPILVAIMREIRDHVLKG